MKKEQLPLPEFDDASRLERLMEAVQREHPEYDLLTVRQIAEASLRSHKHEEQAAKGPRRTEVLEEHDERLQ